MKRTLQQTLLTLIAMVSAHAAIADNGIQYTYAELLYVDAELDNANGDGFSLGGSYRINEEFYARGDFQDIEIEGIDIRAIELGVGYISPYNAMDLIAEVNYVDYDVDVDVDVGDDNGFLLTGGLRTYLAPKLEASASMNYLTIDDNDAYIQLGANYSFTALLSIDGGFRLGSDIDELTIGARYLF